MKVSVTPNINLIMKLEEKVILTHLLLLFSVLHVYKLNIFGTAVLRVCERQFSPL